MFTVTIFSTIVFVFYPSVPSHFIESKFHKFMRTTVFCVFSDMIGDSKTRLSEVPKATHPRKYTFVDTRYTTSQFHPSN
eukprot:UN22695